MLYQIVFKRIDRNKKEKPKMTGRSHSKRSVQVKIINQSVNKTKVLMRKKMVDHCGCVC